MLPAPWHHHLRLPGALPVLTLLELATRWEHHLQCNTVPGPPGCKEALKTCPRYGLEAQTAKPHKWNKGLWSFKWCNLSQSYKCCTQRDRPRSSCSSLPAWLHITPARPPEAVLNTADVLGMPSCRAPNHSPFLQSSKWNKKYFRWQIDLEQCANMCRLHQSVMQRSLTCAGACHHAARYKKAEGMQDFLWKSWKSYNMQMRITHKNIPEQVKNLSYKNTALKCFNGWKPFLGCFFFLKLHLGWQLEHWAAAHETEIPTPC